MSDRDVLLRLLRQFAAYRGWMIAGVALSALTTLASVALMGVAGHFIAAMALAGLAGVLMNYFLPAVAIRFLAIVRTGGRYAERVVTHEATFRLLAELRVWLFRRLLPLAPAALAQERSADLVARVQGDVDTLQQAYLRLYVPVAAATACTLVVGACVAWWSPTAAIVLVLLLVLAGAVVPLAVQRATAPAGREIVATRALLRVRLVDAVQGMSDLALNDAAGRAAGEIAALGRTLAGHQQRAGNVGLLADATVSLAGGLALWLVALVAIAATGAGTLDAANVPMLAFVALASFEAVLPLPQAFQRAGEVAAAARRIFALADATPAIDENAGTAVTPRDTGVVLRDVHLTYPGTAGPALRGVDLAIAGGERVAIVGPSGAGKSSLAWLLVRFYDYTGAITLGGIDLRAWRAADARAFVTVAEQHVHLLNATLRENLLLAAGHASDQALHAALATAGLADFVADAPQGLDTPLGEAGLRLSAGQARRVTLARALLRESPVVILDEPTTGLDTHTGRTLMANLSRAFAGRTLVVITHDIEHVRDHVDRVVTMAQGRISEERSARR